MIKRLQKRGTSMFLNMDRALRDLVGIKEHVKITVYGDEIRITKVNPGDSEEVKNNE